MDYLHFTLGVKTIMTMIIFSLISFFSVSATNHTVGGITGWVLVSNVQNWSSTETFFTGDNLEFIYGPTHDVLEVDQVGYSQCETSSPIRTHIDGDTVISLDKPGTRYFICGTNGHCNKGLKIQVDVLPLLTNSTAPDTGPHRMPPPPEQHTQSPPPPFEPPHSPGPNHISGSGFSYHITSLFLLPSIIMLFV